MDVERSFVSSISSPRVRAPSRSVILHSPLGKRTQLRSWLVGAGRHVGVRCAIDSYNILLVFFDLHGYARKPIKIYFTLPYLSVAVYQEPLVQVLDIPNELPEHRANGWKSRSLLEPDNSEVATCMLKWFRKW